MTAVRHEDGKTVCTCGSGAVLTPSRLIGAYLRTGDEILTTGDEANEILIRRARGRSPHLYYASVGYAAQPRPDRRGELFVRVEVAGGGLGLHLPCRAIRDYFFVTDRQRPWDSQIPLHKVLNVQPTVNRADLRLAYRIRRMELRQANASKHHVATIERAFNVLADPQLKAVYESLLANPDAPTPFPYSGFGALLAEGEVGKDTDVFFARRILAFLPKLRRRTLVAPLRNADFFADHAILRDHNRKLEVFLDQHLISLRWDQTWNQWRRCLAAYIEVTADFVRTGKYKNVKGEWRFREWEVALPSRTAVTVPKDLESLVLKARQTYARFGRHLDLIVAIRRCIELTPMEREELRRICWDKGLPGDFDLPDISWHPDYDRFYYQELSKRARTIHLFRDEYIFALAKVVAVEVLKQGHATYVFSRPERLDEWLNTYVTTSRQEVLANRNNVAEALRFQGRIVHRANKAQWLDELRACNRETPEDNTATAGKA